MEQVLSAYEDTDHPYHVIVWAPKDSAFRETCEIDTFDGLAVAVKALSEDLREAGCTLPLKASLTLNAGWRLVDGQPVRSELW